MPVPRSPIMKVAEVDEAVRLVNDSPFGLDASGLGRDLADAEAVARQLESGAVGVDDALVNYTALKLPMGGAKTSGIWHRHGPGGIRKYCQPGSAHLPPPRPAHPAAFSCGAALRPPTTQNDYGEEQRT